MLKPLMKQAKNNINGRKIETVSADGGYDNLENL